MVKTNIKEPPVLIAFYFVGHFIYLHEHNTIMVQDYKVVGQYEGIVSFFLVDVDITIIY